MFAVKTQKMHKNEICIQKSNKRYLFDIYLKKCNLKRNIMAKHKKNSNNYEKMVDKFCSGW